MVKVYSEDLRKKVISYIMSGCSKKEVARIFNIGENTICDWLKLHKMGDLRSKKRTDSPCKLDEKKLQEYVEQNPDHSLEQVIQALNLAR